MLYNKFIALLVQLLKYMILYSRSHFPSVYDGDTEFSSNQSIQMLFHTWK